MKTSRIALSVLLAVVLVALCGFGAPSCGIGTSPSIVCGIGTSPSCPK